MIDPKLKDFYPNVSTKVLFGIQHSAIFNEIQYYIFNGIIYVSYHRTKKFCEDLHLSGEETLLWYLKFGDNLPYRLSDLK